MNELPPTDYQVWVFLAIAMLLGWGLGEAVLWLVSHLQWV